MTPFLYGIEAREHDLGPPRGAVRRARHHQLRPHRRPEERLAARLPGALSRQSRRDAASSSPTSTSCCTQNPIFVDRMEGHRHDRRRTTLHPLRRHRPAAARRGRRRSTCGRRSHISSTTASTSTCRSARRATTTTATWCASRRCTRAPRIVEQCARESSPAGPVDVDDPRLRWPAKGKVFNHMEELIEQFKLVTEGLRPPAGEVYHAVEGANGELGFYLVTDGSGKPWKCRCRPPSFINTQPLPDMLQGALLADVIPDLRHDQHDRRRVRSMSAAVGGSAPVLSDAVRQAIAAEVRKYPQPRSALLIALHLIQGELGYVPLEAQREVAAFLGIRPIEVREVVTFYPMYHEHPVGRRNIQVCVNIACCARRRSAGGARARTTARDHRRRVYRRRRVLSRRGPVPRLVRDGGLRAGEQRAVRRERTSRPPRRVAADGRLMAIERYLLPPDGSDWRSLAGVPPSGRLRERGEGAA